jgi:hypothetical protein
MITNRIARPRKLTRMALVVSSIAALLVPGASRASAEPACLGAQPQIFPTAQTGQAPPWQWAFANGSQGTIHRYINTFPCSSGKVNALTINMNLANGDYLEVGYYERPNAGTGVDQYDIFYESVVDGTLNFIISNFPCGPMPPSGASGFRVRRFWGTDWTLDVDCANNSTWTNANYLTLPGNPTWGNARAEMERFQRDNSYNTWFRLLKWRQFNDPAGTWKPWSGMGCASMPNQFTSENLRRLTASSFDFIPGTGQC